MVNILLSTMWSGNNTGFVSLFAIGPGFPINGHQSELSVLVLENPFQKAPQDTHFTLLHNAKRVYPCILNQNLRPLPFQEQTKAPCNYKRLKSIALGSELYEHYPSTL